MIISNTFNDNMLINGSFWGHEILHPNVCQLAANSNIVCFNCENNYTYMKDSRLTLISAIHPCKDCGNHPFERKRR